MENLLTQIRDKLDDHVKDKIYNYYVSIVCLEKRELNHHIQLYHIIKQNQFCCPMIQNIHFNNLYNISDDETHHFYYDSDSSEISYDMHYDEF